MNCSAAAGTSPSSKKYPPGSPEASQVRSPEAIGISFRRAPAPSKKFKDSLVGIEVECPFSKIPERKNPFPLHSGGTSPVNPLEWEEGALGVFTDWMEYPEKLSKFEGKVKSPSQEPLPKGSPPKPGMLWRR